MSDVQAIIAIVLFVVGLFFTLVASIGFVRLPDVFCRFHVTGIIDTMGAPLLLLGVAVYLGPNIHAGKLVLGLAFLWFTSPLVGHLLSRAAIEAGYQLKRIAGPVPGQGSVISDESMTESSDARPAGGEGDQ